MSKIATTDSDDNSTSDNNMGRWVAQELAEAAQDKMLEDEDPTLLFTDAESE